MLDLSRVWPELTVVEKIGEGSFGKVYKCERKEFGIISVCAVKVISIPQNRGEIESMSFDGLSEDGAKAYFTDVVNDFANEIKLMEMLKGAPNIVNVEDFRIIERENEIGWDIYIRMEYLQSFVSYSRNKAFTDEDVKIFALDIVNALSVCSKYGVIHRDVKPNNIFIDKFGSFKLGDFGVARRLEGTVSAMSKKGTYSYMAPEVFRGEFYDFRADIYSLGMVMYKLLNRNRDPFIDVDSAVIGFKERNDSIDRRLRGEKLPSPVDAGPAMASVILKAVEFNPENRYASVEEFRNALASLNIFAFAEEPTVASADYYEHTVVARGFEQFAPASLQVGLEDSSLMADYSGAIPEAYAVAQEESTVLYDENAYYGAETVADDIEQENDSKRKKRKNKEIKQKKVKEKKIKEPKQKKSKEEKQKEKTQKVKKTKEKEPLSPSQKFVNGIEIKYFIIAFLMGAFLIAGLVTGTLICYELWFKLVHTCSHSNGWYWGFYFSTHEYVTTMVVNAVVLVLNVVLLCAYGVHKKKPVALFIGAVETTLLVSFEPTLMLCLLPVPILLIAPLVIWTWVEQRKMTEAEFNQHNHCLFKPKDIFITNYVLFGLIIVCEVLLLFVGLNIVILLALCLCFALSVAAIVLNSLTQLKNPKLNVALKFVSIANFLVSLVPVCIYSAYEAYIGVIAGIVLAALALIQTLLTVYTDYKKLMYTE